MKLPNGYGSVTKLTGNRRKPYMARICKGDVYDGKLQDFKPKRIVLGYYATKKDALKALAESDYSHGQARGVLTTKRSSYSYIILRLWSYEYKSICVKTFITKQSFDHIVVLLSVNFCLLTRKDSQSPYLFLVMLS